MITIGPETLKFDIPKNVDKNLKYETDFIIKHNEFLAEHTKTAKLVYYCSNISIEMIFMNTGNSKTNEPHKFVNNLSQRLDLRNSNKHFPLQNLST